MKVEGISAERSTRIAAVVAALPARSKHFQCKCPALRPAGNYVFVFVTDIASSLYGQTALDSPPPPGGGCTGFYEHCLGATSRGYMCLLVKCVQLGCPVKQYELVTSMLGKYVHNVMIIQI